MAVYIENDRRLCIRPDPFKTKQVTFRLLEHDLNSQFIQTFASHSLLFLSSFLPDLLPRLRWEDMVSWLRRWRSTLLVLLTHGFHKCVVGRPLVTCALPGIWYTRRDINSACFRKRTADNEREHSWDLATPIPLISPFTKSSLWQCHTISFLNSLILNIMKWPVNRMRLAVYIAQVQILASFGSIRARNIDVPLEGTLQTICGLSIDHPFLGGLTIICSLEESCLPCRAYLYTSEAPSAICRLSRVETAVTLLSIFENRQCC